MQRLILWLFLLPLVVACGAGEAEVPPAASEPAGLFLEEPPSPEPAVPPTEALPEPTPEPFPGAVFYDSFDARLGDGWQLVPDEAGRYSLEANPGLLRLAAGPEFDVPAQALFPAPSGDFQVTTLVLFEPTSNFQFAGLTIVANDGQRVNFGRAFADCGENPACRGNAIYFDLLDETGGGPNYATVVDLVDLAYLRLRREGNAFSGYFSADGEKWQPIGRHTSALIPAQVGLITGQAMFEPVAADFDFFALESLP